MNKIQQAIVFIGQSLQKESPTILTGVGVAGFVTTVGLAITATPKACRLYEDMMTENPKPTNVDILMKMLPLYIPTIVIGGAAITCFIMSNDISLRRNAALVSLYTLTEKSFKNYQEKVLDQIGAKKEERIRDSISQDRLNEYPVQQAIIFGKGEALCFDSLSSRYFLSEMQTLRKAQNDFNSELFREGYKTLNEWYYLLGLESTGMGTSTGWTNEGGMLEVYYATKISTDDRPCLVLNYENGPRNL